MKNKKTIEELKKDLGLIETWEEHRHPDGFEDEWLFDIRKETEDAIKLLKEKENVN